MTELKSLSISGFKTIGRLDDFELKRVNLLIGANGSGKSNFVSFFRFLSHLCNSQLQEFINTHGLGSSFLTDGPAKTQRLKAHLKFRSDQGTSEYSFQLAHAAPDSLIFVEEKYRPNESQQWSGFVEGVSHESQMVDQSELARERTARMVRDCLRRCIVHQFDNTSETARIRLGWYADDNRYLKEDGANLASVLLRLREESPQYYRRILENVRLAAPHFHDFELSPSGGKLLLRCTELGTDMVFGPHQISDGTLRIMALFTLLLQPEDNMPNVVILDEPELGLHPHAIGMLAGMIKSASKHAQVILATQSLNLLNYFEPEDIIVMERPERETVFKRLQKAELDGWLEEYSMAELWEKNVLGGTPQA
jgi:predicted ATPase